MNAPALSGAPAVLPVPVEQAVAQFLTFSLRGEVYAVPILNIKEIIEFGTLTEVPMMPGFIRGVINLRGRVVPVVDLLARFGLGRTEVARRTSIVIVEVVEPGEPGEVSTRIDIGVMVDAVNEVIEIQRTNIELPPEFGPRIRSEFISGMARSGKGFMIVLNVDRVLSVDEMAMLPTDLCPTDNAQRDCS